MKITLKSIGNFFATIFVVGFIGTCTYALNESDKQAEKICNATAYFVIKDKDYKDLSTNMLYEDVSFVVYIKRYDKNKKYIPDQRRLSRIRVSHYYYEKLEVGNKIWREDLNRWEEKVKLFWFISCYKYTLRIGAGLKTRYSLIRKKKRK